MALNYHPFLVHLCAIVATTLILLMAQGVGVMVTYWVYPGEEFVQERDDEAQMYRAFTCLVALILLVAVAYYISFKPVVAGTLLFLFINFFREVYHSKAAERVPCHRSPYSDTESD